MGGSAHAVAMLEMAARSFVKAKERDIRKASVARYDSREGDTFGYDLKYLPRMLLYRNGYSNPKMYDGEMSGPDQILDWLRNEVVNVYMKDDPKRFHRTEKIGT